LAGRRQPKTDPIGINPYFPAFPHGSTPIMEEKISQPLAQFIAEKIIKQPKREIQPDEALISSGLIDSFSLVDLALYIEDAFGVHIADTELNVDTFDTLHQLVQLIQQRQA
jgi:acyl carrier protein